MWLRVVTVLLISVAAAQSQTFRNSYALIVGVNDYPGFGLQHLSNAENDARAVEAYFHAQGYQVTSLVGTQASTKKKVEDSVQAIAARITESDRFVFYFAGHGKNQRTQGLDVAYLIVPGGRNTDDPASLISTGDVVRYSHLLDRARHQLFIFDSCYAGLMGNFQSRSESKPLRFDSEDFLVRDLSNRRVRQYLSAGGEDQEVLDNGPQQLSWFTYFLRKGLEPGEVSRRDSGLMTFSELASYVQAMSANPKHTPAFGTLAGNQGGEFLFLTTAQGSPKLPLLPTINRQILLDMGFLTRSLQPASVGLNIDRMREPIDQLFQAWLQKSVDLYLRQLDRRIVQTGQLKNGTTYSRGYDEIARRRRADFDKLDHVDLPKYEVMYQGSQDTQATFGVRYSMDFYWKDGTSTQEHNVNECYDVRRVSEQDRWAIIRNDDYQHHLCSR